MAVGVGDILFSHFFADDVGLVEGSFSFVVTTSIAPGETITFYQPETTPGDNAFFTYTVGAVGGGLSAGDFVRFEISTGNVPSVVADPSSGSVGGMTNTWNDFGSDNIIAGSGGIAIAGISNDDPATTTWDENRGNTPFDFTAIDAAIALPTDPLPAYTLGGSGSIIDDNAIWKGGAFTGIDDPSNWDISNSSPDHSTGDPDGGGAIATNFTSQRNATPCFAPGTLIATETGEATVETLQIGDMLRAADGRVVPVKWIGVFTAHKLRCSASMEPVCFAAGSLGEGLPHSELVITADHGMLIDDLVITASALVNGTNIVFKPLSELPEQVTYYHIETDAHDVILANGAESETFVDIPSRQNFDNYDEYVDLYGAERLICEMPQPRITAQRLVPTDIKSRLGIGVAAIGTDLAEIA